MRSGGFGNAVHCCDADIFQSLGDSLIERRMRDFADDAFQPRRDQLVRFEAQIGRVNYELSDSASDKNSGAPICDSGLLKPELPLQFRVLLAQAIREQALQG
ncbi:hypothetical protein, partial [Mesorhizobium metallidurans]|uniref:hypothetical protein n=1 Tax=Mesorhizobium metallidurans TaxID=489722 RepID=UPI001ADF2573